MSRDDERLSDLIDDLHDEAMQLIRSGHLRWYSDINETYREIVLAFPRESKRYGSAELADETDFFHRGPVEHIERTLYEEVVEVLRYGSREFAFEAMATPRRIAEDAFSIDAPNLVRRMLALSHSLYRAAKNRGGEVADNSASYCALLLIEFIDHRFNHPMTFDETLSVSERERLSSYLALGFDALAEIARHMIDANDSKEFVELDTRWADMLEYWDPEFQSPAQWDVSQAVRTYGELDERTIEIKERHAQNVQLAALKRQVADRREVYWLYLLHWALTAPPEIDPVQRTKVVNQLAGHFESVGAVVRAMDTALQSEWASGSTLLSRWMWDRREPRFGSGVYDPDLGLTRTFVVLTLWRMSTTGETELPPTRWIRLHSDRLTSIASGLAPAKDELAAIDISNLTEIQQRFQEAVQRVVVRQTAMEKEEVKTAQISSDRVDVLRLEVTRHWLQSRVLPYVLMALGLTPRTEAADAELPTKRSVLLPKAFFIEPVRLGGLESRAARIGTTLAQGELGHVLNGPLEELADGTSVEARVRRLTGNLRASGKPFVLALSRNWRIARNLGLPLAGAQPPAEWNITDHLLHGFAGYFEGIPCFRVWGLDEGEIATISLENHVQWVEHLDQTTGGPRMVISEIDEAAARALIPATEESDVQRIEELLTKVRVEILEWLDLRIDDPQFLGRGRADVPRGATGFRTSRYSVIDSQ